MGVALDGYACRPFTAEGETREVYRRGSGPAVVVIHEMPGITPAVAGFGAHVAEAGFTAVLPSLFGTPGREVSTPYVLGQLARGCVAREFAALAIGRTAPVTSWLRALARSAHEECGGPGVGVVGMCFTGGFGLCMAVDDTVLAPVLSQPSLPIGFSKRKKADLAISRADLDTVKARDDLCVLGLRYRGDPMVPGERFETLRRELGDRFIAVELPGKRHSVLTEHLDEPARERTIEFLRERLRPDG